MKTAKRCSQAADILAGGDNVIGLGLVMEDFAVVLERMRGHNHGEFAAHQENAKFCDASLE